MRFSQMTRGIVNHVKSVEIGVNGIVNLAMHVLTAHPYFVKSSIKNPLRLSSYENACSAYIRMIKVK